jgi:sphingolipid 4-desaturase/C4-monooxygenase
MSEQSFIQSKEPIPHFSRTRDIIKKHPEVKQLNGKNPMTAVIALLCVLSQVSIAYLLTTYNQPWWVVALTAYFVGAFINHVVVVIIHEASHYLLFENRGLNVAFGLIVNLPAIIPSFISFQKYHLKHHAYQGIHETDTDMPEPWEAKLVGNSAIMKAIWLACFPILQIMRVVRVKDVAPFDGWTALNWATQLAFVATVYYFLGSYAILYMFLSFYFSLSLHPLGGRWIQEHFVLHDQQETYSYYGGMNLMQLNIGYHNEHHDFPGVAWDKLPKIKATAPEFYNTLYAHQSWTGLVWRFITDKNISLYSRIERSTTERKNAAPTTMIKNGEVIAA